MIKLNKLFFLIFIISTKLFSQEVEFYAQSSKTTISEDEKFNVEFGVNKDVQKFIPPNFSDFVVVTGPSQSSSVYTRIINGKYSPEKKVTYTYILRPKQKGKLTIENATVYVDGKYYKTKPLTVEVMDYKDMPKDLNTPAGIARSNVHFVVELSKRNPYIGESITAIYKLYFNANINSPNVVSQPSFDGFISNEIKLKEDRTAKKGNYTGQSYNEYVVREVILTPNRVGKIKIEPYKLDINVAIPTGKYDWFGNTITKNEGITLKTDVKYVEVKPLPEEGKPSNFKNAVGDFDLRVDVDRTTLNANESIQLKTILSGKGNLDLVEVPEISIPNELEKYDPKDRRNINRNSKGISGNISKEYLIVPRYKGVYKIPPLEFSYFSIEEKKYKTIRTKEILINVENGDSLSSIGKPNVAYQNEKSKVEYISDSNISYIKLRTSLKNINTKNIISVNNIVFYLLYLLPFFGVIGFIALERKRKNEAKDLTGTRKKKASSVIRKRLKSVKQNLDKGKNKEFYEELEIALYTFISDKFSIQKSELSKDSIMNFLKNKGVEVELSDELLSLLNECEMAKYAPSFNVSENRGIFEKTCRIIEKINKKV